MSDLNSNSMKKFLWFSLILASATFMCLPVADPDLWWHITVGRWIIAHAEVPSVDLWNLFAVNKPWVPYSWSNEVVFAWVDSTFGIYGLLACKFILIISLLLSLCVCLSKISGSWFLGTFLGVFAAFGTSDHLTLRPQTVVWILFIFLIYVSDKIKEEGFDWKKAVFCLLIGSAWANSHLSAFLGILVVAAWTYRSSNKNLCLLATISFVLGTLLTPHFGSEWLIFFNKASHPMEYSIISEFKPANILQYATVFLVLVVVLQAIFFHFQHKLINPLVLVVSICFTLGSLAVVKFVPFAIILGVFILAKIWSLSGGGMRSFGNISESFFRLEVLWNKIPVQGLTFVFLCLVIRNSFAVYQVPLNEAVVPVKAMDYIVKHHQSSVILNGFGQGGYVMYRMSSKNGVLENRVPIDGRTNINSPQAWEAFRASLLGKRSWRDFIELVKPEVILWKRESAFVTLLREEADWKLVYEDGTDERGWVVFSKNLNSG